MKACFDTSGVWPDRRVHHAQRPGINWRAVECDYREGRLSLREMASKHGCSHSAIANHARRHDWTRGSVSPARPDLAAPGARRCLALRTAPAGSGSRLTEEIK
jgi:hypothetical protein